MNIPRLLIKYRKEAVPTMMTKFGYRSLMSVPRLEKAVINVGVGRLAKDDKMMAIVERDLALITGQKPIPTCAKKSIASFKVRQGTKVGYKVTLRGRRMYDFIDRLVSIAFPRTRDFQGLNPKSVDSRGTLNIGIHEHSIFPEVHYESLKEVFGLEVAVVTSAKKPKEALELLRLLGFPFKRVKG